VSIIVSLNKMKMESAPPLFVKISTLRIMLLIAISIAGFTSGSLSFYFIRNYQWKLYEQNFENTALDSFESIKQSLFVKLQLNLQVALGASLSCPKQSQWPNCAAPSEVFVDRTSSLVAVTRVSEFAILPIVQSADQSSFEAFALSYYQSDGGYPPSAGLGGVFAVDSEGNLLPASNLTNAGRYDIVMPVLQVSNISTGSLGLLYDTHSDPVVASTLDDVLDCVSEASLSITQANAMERKNIQTRCSSITDFGAMMDLRATVIGTPILLRDNPSKVVGFAGALFTWGSVLQVSSRVDSTFQCVITSSASSVRLIYSVTNGVVREETELPKPVRSDQFFDSDLKQSFLLNGDGLFPSETQYTITYHSSDTPPTLLLAIAAGVCCLSVTLAITLIFEVFSFLSKMETRKAKTLLDSKRIFVRFISHEIRSVPLPLCHPL
jgi:hypothetical protein